MAKKAKNKNFQTAKSGKKDEFYTQLSDIERELKHYKKHFKNKVVYCNCDDPRVSNFFHYFSYNFEKLGLKKLIATCYKNQSMELFSTNDSEQAIYLEYEGDKNGNMVPDPEEIGIKELKGDGDFRSRESIELLKQADIVVTNPPFSLFREYVAQLLEYDKKFLIIGNGNSITYKEIFKNVQENQLWLGTTKPRLFLIDNKEAFAKYCSDSNKVGKVKDIPIDYEGEMGVPITFLDKYNPSQFEIIGSSMTLGENMKAFAEKGTYSQGGPRFYLDKGDGTYRRLYDRIVIKKRK